jgi:hypothetical protein
MLWDPLADLIELVVSAFDSILDLVWTTSVRWRGGRDDGSRDCERDGRE